MKTKLQLFSKHFIRNRNLFTINQLNNSQFYSTSGSGSVVEVENIKGITTIGINRPEKRNCVNIETAKRLKEAFHNFENDSESTAAVLYGKGGTFCAGLDLKEVSENPEEYVFTNNPDVGNGAGPMGPSRRLFKKPVIAAVSGYAVAGGLEIALMCDMRVVEETAILGIFCRRFGVPLIDGGTVRLARLIGLSRAMDLIITGRGIKGKEALEFGLANRLVPSGASLNEAIKLAVSLQAFPQECLNADRTSAYNALYNAESFEDAVKFEMEKGCEIILKESVQGATRFTKGIGRHGSFNLDNPEKKEKF